MKERLHPVVWQRTWKGVQEAPRASRYDPTAPPETIVPASPRLFRVRSQLQKRSTTLVWTENEGSALKPTESLSMVWKRQTMSSCR